MSIRRLARILACSLSVAVLVLAFQNCGPMAAMEPMGSFAESSTAQIGSDVLVEIPVPGPTPAVADGSTTAATMWRNSSFQAQTGSFAVEFDLVPLANKMDGVIAVSSAALGTYSGAQMMLRLNPVGTFDVRNGDAYEAATPVAYFATQTYRVKMTANISSQSYSVSIRAPGDTMEKVLADGVAFRADAPMASSLGNLGIVAPVGSFKIVNFAVKRILVPNPTATPKPSPTPTPNPVQGSVSFFGDWGTNSSTGGWKARQTVSSDRIRVDGKTWHGLTAARVQVSPGDDPINSSGERSEVLGMSTSESASSGIQYYALSYKFPSNWQSTDRGADAQWSIIFQLHGPDSLGTSPSFALSALQNGYAISLHSGDLSRGGSWLDYPLSGTMAKDVWTDFIIRIDYKADTTGRVTIWRRDEGQTSFQQVLDRSNIATLQYKGSVGAHYWKQGLYRGQSFNLTNVLWMGPTARATTFEAAELKAFGTRNGMP